MTRLSTRPPFFATLVLGCSLPAYGQGDAPPPLTAPPEVATPGDNPVLLRAGDAATLPSAEAPAHEAFRAGRQPPSSIVERPSGASPDPGAVWIKGYWEWDEARKDFAWVVGGWRVPPPGKFWRDGTWKQDEKGWYRVPGSWVDNPGASGDWRRDGPPAEHPADLAGPAPVPGTFLVAGIYVPDGDRIVWKPGFWAASRPGWDWIPARWVRRADGWSFRPGTWQADGSSDRVSPFSTAPRDAPSPVVRHAVARPAGDSLGLQPLPDGGQIDPASRSAAPSTSIPVGSGPPPAGPAEADGDVVSTSADAPPASPPPTAPISLILPDGRRVLMVPPGGGVANSAPNGPPGAAPPATRPQGQKRGLPLLRALNPLRRDPRRSGR